MPGSVLFVWLYWSIFIVLRVPCAPCVIIINSGPHRNCACMIRSAVAVRKCMLVHFFVVLCCIWLGGFWLPLYMLKLEQRIRAYVNILHRY